jgi:WD repeat-containing protein 68
MSFGKLKNHKDCVNSLCWAPQSTSHLCSVGDDSQAFIWDLQTFKE